MNNDTPEAIFEPTDISALSDEELEDVFGGMNVSIPLLPS